MDELIKIAMADDILTEAVWEKVAAEAGTTPEEAVAQVAQAVAENPEIAPAVEEAVEEEKESMLADYAILMDKLAGAGKAAEEAATKAPGWFRRTYGKVSEHIGRHPKSYAAGLAGLTAAGGLGGGYALGRRTKKSAAELLAEALYL